MNHKDVETTGEPIPEDGSWSDGQNKRAKRTLYEVADAMTDDGVTESEVVKYLALFGPKIGYGSFTGWETRLYDWAEKHTPKTQFIPTPSQQALLKASPETRKMLLDGSWDSHD